jgi:hypothetical protein
MVDQSVSLLIATASYESWTAIFQTGDKMKPFRFFFSRVLMDVELLPSTGCPVKHRTIGLKQIDMKKITKRKRGRRYDKKMRNIGHGFNINKTENIYSIFRTLQTGFFFSLLPTLL